MKKRFVSALLAFAMAFAMMVPAAMAADHPEDEAEAQGVNPVVICPQCDKGTLAIRRGLKTGEWIRVEGYVCNIKSHSGCEKRMYKYEDQQVCSVCNYRQGLGTGVSWKEEVIHKQQL